MGNKVIYGKTWSEGAGLRPERRSDEANDAGVLLHRETRRHGDLLVRRWGAEGMRG